MRLEVSPLNSPVTGVKVRLVLLKTKTMFCCGDMRVRVLPSEANAP